MFDALEILTEPHRLIQSLTSVIAIILPFIRETGPHSSRNKVIPLMMGILPALDTNDFEKCILAIQGFKYMFKLVSIVDCQNAITLRTDLSEVNSLIVLNKTVIIYILTTFKRMKKSCAQIVPRLTNLLISSWTSTL